MAAIVPQRVRRAARDAPRRHGAHVDNPRLVSEPIETTRKAPPRERIERGDARPRNVVPPISFPESLPVSQRREEIAQALATHQVIIVCGETGSGKTTQLPKIALQLGRGLGAGGKGLIGHTQPRRIAASSVAKRIAQELNSPLGEVVGFKVRFQDRLQPGASVKLMTDGILLAETQSDPLLRAYDTLIVDEAHERSLNIDFLLGHLRQILGKRPDLKVIVTSATIDADRFAKHFANADGPAPVILVSGRLFPVEQRWRPFVERRDHDLNDAIAEAVDELWRDGGPGDILVFLPGEREIRDAADHLRKHLAQAQAIRRRAARAAGGNPAAVRAVEPAGAGACVRHRWRAAHRAGHQRGRDLAHRARHPLRHRQRAGACQALQLAHQGRAAAGRANQPGGREPARRTLWPRRQRRLHSPVRRGRLCAAATLHRSGNPALVAGRRDPSHEVVAPGVGGRVPLPGGAAEEGHRRRLRAARRAERRGRHQRADRHRPGANKAAAGPACRPHDPGGARSPLPARGTDHCLRIERPGRARPAARTPTGRRREAQEVRRREVGVQRHPQAVEVGRRRAWRAWTCRPGHRQPPHEQPPAGTTPA